MRCDKNRFIHLQDARWAQIAFRRFGGGQRSVDIANFPETLKSRIQRMDLDDGLTSVCQVKLYANGTCMDSFVKRPKRRDVSAGFLFASEAKRNFSGTI